MSATFFKETVEAGMESRERIASTRRIILQKGDNIAARVSIANTIYEIKHDFNLNDAVVRIGKNSVLRFNGGSLCNGTLIGANTKIEGDKEGILESVHIEGSWNVPQISTAMWKSLDYPNSLKDVFALQSSNVWNTLIVGKNNYDYRLVAGAKEGILNVLDNTEIIINGNIVLSPNAYPNYEMIRVSSCTNVKISGTGSMSGDRTKHDYKTHPGTHEYGHGIVFRSSKNVEISGITLKDFTGDALCLMDNCSDFNIHDLNIQDCRRCGVSIRADHGITIDNCSFSDIVNDEYNEPSAAIDIEPVVACKVYDIIIKNCHFNNIARGISSAARNYYGKTFKSGDKLKIEERRYVNLEITNCRFENSTYTAFIAPFGWERVIIKRCTFYNGRQEDIRIAYTTNCIVKNCTTSCDAGRRVSLSRSFVSPFFENKSVRVDNCKGNNMRKVFSEDKNCRIVRSEFVTK